jgi:hypothetical protein
MKICESTMQLLAAHVREDPEVARGLQVASHQTLMLSSSREHSKR